MLSSPLSAEMSQELWLVAYNSFLAVCDFPNLILNQVVFQQTNLFDVNKLHQCHYVLGVCVLCAREDGAH